MSRKTIINNVFSIGYRCVTDDFLKKLNIRKYSSPFSYMFIDYITAIYFINNNFVDYLDVVQVNSNVDYKIYDKEIGTHRNLFVHKLVFENSYLIGKTITDWDKICIWNHHNIYEQGDKIINRTQHFMNCINIKPHSMLLFCIDKIIKFDNTQIDKIYYDLDILTDVIKKYSCHIILLVPLFNYNKNKKK